MTRHRRNQTLTVKLTVRFSPNCSFRIAKMIALLKNTTNKQHYLSQNDSLFVPTNQPKYNKIQNDSSL
jgi:hypothetical protein